VVRDPVTKGTENIFFCNQRELYLCLELLTGVIIGWMLIILVYFIGG